MSENKSTMPSSALILRILAGGYLLYLAWDLRGAPGQNPLFWIPVLAFLAIGGVLLFHSIRTLARSDYFRKDSTEESEEEAP